MRLKLFLALLALTTIAAVVLGTLSAGGQQPTLISTPTPLTEPPGIEAPLGRYDEPPSLLPLAEAAPAPPGPTGSANAPSITAGFNGIGQEPDSNGFIHSPPDTHAAVGTDRIVSVTNGHVAIYNKTGGLIAGGDSGAGAVDLLTFCGGNDCFDPKVIFDQTSQRFVAVAIEGRQFADSYLHVMVSTNSTPGNLTTDWDKFRQVAGTNITSNGWFDYPGLGVSPDTVVVTGNIFTDADVFQGTKIRVFDKAELYDGDATATFVDIDRGQASGGTIMPAHHFGSPPSGTFYLLQGWGSASLRVTALTSVPSSPTVSSVLTSTSDQGICIGSAPQQGTTKVIDTVCPRMMNSIWRDGSLWGTLTRSDSSDVRAVAQWFEIETNGYPSSSPTLRQHGTVDEGAGEFTYMPSISVDSCGNAALTYTQSSSSRFPEMRYTGRLSTDTLNTLQASSVAKASAFFFDDFTGLPDGGPAERWGDYSATVIDPVDQSFWIAHQYARVAATGGGNDGRWGTWLTNFTFGCTPPPTPTPTPCPTGGCPTPTITPTATVTPTATITPTATVTPTPIQSEMILNVKGGATSCAPTKCDVPVNGKFILAVDVVTAPPAGYIALQTYIDFGVYNPAASEDGAGPNSCSDSIDNGGDGKADRFDADCVTVDLVYKATAQASDEIIWPDLDPRSALRIQPGLGLLYHAGTTEISSSPPPSTFEGNVTSVQMTCPSSPIQATINLLPYNDPIAGSYGSGFVEPYLTTIVVPKVGSLTINCVVPPTPTPTATPTSTPTVPPTSTKQPFKGDTDGDGCPDVNENLPKAQMANGGGRDYKNPWDWYDVDQNGSIDLFVDILGVINHYSLDGSPPYDVVYDRGPSAGPNAWNMTAPDGRIDLFIDILGVIGQYSLTGCTVDPGA